MRTSWIGLAVLVISLLIATDAVLDRRADRRRLGMDRVSSLVALDERDAEWSPGELLIGESGRRHRYRKGPRAWRCVSFHEAVADHIPIEETLPKLRKAIGEQRAAPDDAAWIELEYIGRDRDGRERRIQVSLGPRLEGGRRLARTADGVTLQLDFDPAPGLPQTERSDASPQVLGALRPPWLDPTLVTSLRPFDGSAERLHITPEGHATYTLERRRRSITPDQLRSGESPDEWWMKNGTNEVLLDQQKVSHYLRVLYSARWEALTSAPPTTSPAASIQFEGADGSTVQLTLHPEGPTGWRARHSAAEVTFDVPEEIAPTLGPSRAFWESGDE